MIVAEMSITDREWVIFVMMGNSVPLCGRGTEIYISFIKFCLFFLSEIYKVDVCFLFFCGYIKTIACRARVYQGFCLCEAENTQKSRGLVPCPWFLGNPMPVGVVMSATAWLGASVLFFTSGSAVQCVCGSSKASQRQPNCWCMVQGTCDCEW